MRPADHLSKPSSIEPAKCHAIVYYVFDLLALNGNDLTGQPLEKRRAALSNDRLIRLSIEVNYRNLALGHDVFDAEDATFVRNTKLPDIIVVDAMNTAKNLYLALGWWPIART